MSYRVWVRCTECGSGNQSPTILDHPVNERTTCPGCKAAWQNSQIVARVPYQGTSEDNVSRLS